MSTKLLLPKLGVSMTVGTIAEWLVDDGATVEEGEPIYVLTSDKVDNEIEAPVAGVIHLSAEPGEELAVGTLIAEIEPA